MTWYRQILMGLALLTAVAGCDGLPVLGQGPPPRCDAGGTVCANACVDLQTSAAHCGACGAVCASNEICVSGACRLDCPAGQSQCGSQCVDRQSDRLNCGACGTACAAGQVCAAGVCQVSCVADLSNCSGTCRDLASDRAHCGACGTACAEGQVCSAGMCQVSCGAGLSNCAGSCRDLQNDRANCGVCGTACPAGQVCAMGACAVSCVAGLSNCSGTCRDVQTDRANCGACGTTCAEGQVCSAGMCQVSCGAGLANCAGTCRDLQTDRAHCGVCGTACAEGQVCSAGMCQVSCSAGLSNCAGTCRDLQTDRAHCGVCGTVCAEGQICSAGACRVSCVAGLTDCAGTCRDLQGDLANCGACGTTCASGQVCAAGVCAASCRAGQVVCAGACTSTQFDPANCGACGTACGPYDNAAASCTAGSCVQTCTAGFADCNADRADGCERNLNADLTHCGRCGNACPARANASASCAAGVCGFTCNDNFADCDGNPNNGCESDLRVTTAHCSRCGNACAAANGVAACAAGACTVASCTAPFRDCDMNPANGCENDTRLTCGGCDLACRDRTVGASGAAFDAGGQRGTAVDPARGGLVVSGMSTTTTLDFLWVVNTAESSVSKWDATGQREVARYRVGLAAGECRGLCCYNSGCNMPSRVVVDGNGDAYVASRGFGTQGSVTKLAAERTNCVDRNGNGMIDTSSSATDVKPYGADECVLWTSNVGTPDAILRALATDRGDVSNPFGYVWVGGYNTSRAYRLDPRTGVTLGTYALAVRPYGMVVTRDGTLWVSSIDSGAMQPVNTTALTVGTAVPYPASRRLSGTCTDSYGLTADGRGRIWLAGWGCRDAIGYDPALSAWTRVDTTSLIGGTAGRGITVDADGRIWMNYATTGDTTSGGLLSWDSNAFVAGGNIPAASVTSVSLPGGFTGPSALGVDRVGNVWAAHYLAPSPLIRYTPSTGASVVLYGPNQVYSYSDFTGSVRRTSIAQGTYEEVIDLGCAAPVLTNFTWTASTPAGTSISFAGRTAATVAGLGAATAVTLALAPRDASPVDLARVFSTAAVTPAQQFRISISLQSSEGGATPILTSFNVGWRCPL
jgi:streptogramin lyase